MTDTIDTTGIAGTARPSQASLFPEVEPSRKGARSSRAPKPAQTLTTSQQLGSLIKSARDIMRKDKGLSGDLDRLPMLTWIMFRAKE